VKASHPVFFIGGVLNSRADLDVVSKIKHFWVPSLSLLTRTQVTTD
jgi:hypothetical protein